MRVETDVNRTQVQIFGNILPGYSSILSASALEFLAKLQKNFGPTREALLRERERVQDRIDQGWLPEFAKETAEVRNGEWKVAPVPAEIQDRRVEITGPVDRKMVINALNSGAQVYMADFEDSHSPTWDATIDGQINLFDAVRGTIRYVSPEGKNYALQPKTAVLFVRPRGWHLVEKHVSFEGKPLSASLFDFGLFLFHNAQALLKKGSAPYFYLPKMESYREARLWNDVFVFAQKELGIPQGTIKATVLIETILAAFQMDEILFELKEHSAGLNCGRWDYIFSFIKKFRGKPDFVLPDRSLVTMNTHFLRSYSQLLIKTCHRRGAHAMGGMAAQIPIKNDPQANTAALDKVRADKLREVRDGHDGTWVAHPGLVGIAREVFDENMKGPNQISKAREDVHVQAPDLLQVPEGSITENGFRTNVNIALLYLESWLRGAGCVPLYNLMEDAATAEISRAQLWQWIRHPKGVLTDGRKVTIELFMSVLKQEMKSREGGKFEQAAAILEKITVSEKFEDFITLPAYECL